MKKIVLGISASPRAKGNTEILIKYILDQVRDKRIETKFVSFPELEIKPCVGCGYCAKNKRCKLEDDCERVFGLIKGADFIIIGSPVYRIGVPAQLKALIDRSSYLIQRNELFSDKLASIAIVGRKGATGKIQTANTLVDFFLSMDAIIVPPIVIGNAHKKGEIKEDRIALLVAKQLGLRINKIMKRLY